MKRELKATKGVEFPSPPYQNAHERELSDMVEKMIRIISERFKNQAIKGLDAKTVAKFADQLPDGPIQFADEQVGNFAKVFLTLSKRVSRKLRKQFPDSRIEYFVHNLLAKTDKANRTALYAKVENRLGIPSAELLATEGLTPTINALQLETAQWVKKLRDETLEFYTANTLRVMAQGGSLTDVLSEFDGMQEKRKNHAKFTARNQVANYNSLVTKARAQNLGITQAKWVTAGDERVRPCHEVRDGKEFELNKGLYASCDGKWLLPGVDYQCRCTYELIIPEEDGV